jgi:hypothetical protein
MIKINLHIIAHLIFTPLGVLGSWLNIGPAVSSLFWPLICLFWRAIFPSSFMNILSSLKHALLSDFLGGNAVYLLSGSSEFLQQVLDMLEGAQRVIVTVE